MANTAHNTQRNREINNLVVTHTSLAISSPFKIVATVLGSFKNIRHWQMLRKSGFSECRYILVRRFRIWKRETESQYHILIFCA
jgi:hypothetical protein